MPANSTATCDGTACGFTCNTGFHACGNACLSNTSPSSCGTSCAACASGPANSQPSCSAGTCGFTCTAGYTRCGSACVYTVRDNANCGACGVTCPAMETCSAGVCRQGCLIPWTASVAAVLDGGKEPNAIFTRDLDRDGKPELVVVDYGYMFFPYDQGQVRVLKNQGGFAFTDGGVYQLPNHPLASGFGDVNGDGQPDLVSNTQDYSSYYQTALEQLLGVDGGLRTPTFIDYGNYAPNSGLAVGDFTGDGFDDAVFVSGVTSSQFSLYLLRGSSTGLLNQVNADAGLDWGSVLAAGDFDRDGRLDVVAPHPTTGASSCSAGWATAPSPCPAS